MARYSLKSSAAFCLGVMVCCLAGSRARGAAAAPADPESLRKAIALQIALEREGFSPGIVDAILGGKTTAAIREFQLARSLPPTGQLDAATTSALRIPDPGAVIKSYHIEPADVKKVAPTPKSWVAKSKMKYLGYSSLAEEIGEKFHCSQALLARLNPGVSLSRLKAGDTVMVPAVDAPKLGKAHRLEIDLTKKTIRTLARDDRPVAFFHCSVAAKPEKRPKKDARIVGVTNSPVYRFDPAMWPEVRNVPQRLLIPPGPRNPVGMCWIALSLRGYGIHGTPNPELIGKTGSHGCFRMTNWDATRLGQMVDAGVAIKFVGR